MSRNSWLNVMLLLSGCASTPSLEHFAPQSIDRTRTLPRDLGSWRLITHRALDEESNLYAYPLYWEHGLTDRLTVVWMPLPMEAHYLLHQSEQSWWTLGAAFLGSTYSRSKDYNWRPSLELHSRHRICGDVTKNWALNFSFLPSLEIKRASQNNFASVLEWRVGVIHQATSWLAVTPMASLVFEKGETLSRYSGTWSSSHRGVDAYTMRTVFPLELMVEAQAHRQWALQLNIRYFGLGYVEGYHSVPVFLSVLHYF